MSSTVLGVYAELVCRSNYSFLEGASHPEELVFQAVQLGLSGLALTDGDGLYGSVKAHLAAREVGLKPPGCWLCCTPSAQAEATAYRRDSRA